MRMTRIWAPGVAGALLTVAVSASGQERPMAPAARPADRADQPLLQEIPPPALAFEGGGGIDGFISGRAPRRPPWNARRPPPLTPPGGRAGGGIKGCGGGGAAGGPTWNARATAASTPRWALEGNYLGSVNRRHDNNANMVVTQVDASARYNILRGGEAPVQPFVTAGIGYAGFSGRDGDMASVVVPVGVGVERMLTPSIKVGARANFRPVLGEDLRTPRDRAANASGPGGDTWSLTAHLGGGF